MNVNSNMINNFPMGGGCGLFHVRRSNSSVWDFFQKKVFKELLLSYVKNFPLVHENNSNNRRSRQAQK